MFLAPRQFSISSSIFIQQVVRYISSTTKSQSFAATEYQTPSIDPVPFIPTTSDIKMAPVPMYESPSEESLISKRTPQTKVSTEVYQMNLIGQTIQKKLLASDPAKCANPDELDPFYVCDLGEVKNLVKLWREHLPRINPYYAVKCNNNPKLISTISELGLGFDCASKNEIKLVMESHGVDASRIIYANPCKTVPYIRYAKDHGVNLTTVDNLDELYKLKEFHSETGILIRLQTDDSTSTCPLSVKFGADVTESKLLIDECINLGLNIRGVAFHIGSGCNNFNTIEKAVTDSKILFQYAREQHDLQFDVLDIGGGFSKDTFTSSSAILNATLEKHFPVAEYEGKLGMISELGRFLSATCFTLAVHVTSKRRDLVGELKRKKGESNVSLKERVYVNDGVYGNLNCILFDHQVVEPRVLTSKGEFTLYDNYLSDPEKFAVKDKEYSIWGPTCDGLDCISAKCSLSNEVEVGDWLYFKNVGAYTSVASTCFNGFENGTECLYVDSSF